MKWLHKTLKYSGVKGSFTPMWKARWYFKLVIIHIFKYNLLFFQSDDFLNFVVDNERFSICYFSLIFDIVCESKCCTLF